MVADEFLPLAGVCRLVGAAGDRPTAGGSRRRRAQRGGGPAARSPAQESPVPDRTGAAKERPGIDERFRLLKKEEVFAERETKGRMTLPAMPPMFTVRRAAELHERQPGARQAVS